jgi:replication fork protection complex subunit Tof1/Swi1
VPLTWPVDEQSDFVPEQLDHLLGYKEAFTHPGVYICILKIIMRSLGVERRQRKERDLANIRFVLTLLRNVLAIPVPRPSVNSSAEAFVRSSLQEAVIVAMYKESALEFIVTLAGNLEQSEFVEWNMLILEIIFYILQGRNAVELGKPANNSDELRAVLMADKARTSVNVVNSRHSRFGGAYSFKMADGKLYNSFKQGAAHQSLDKTLNNGKKGRAGGIRKAKDVRFNVIEANFAAWRKRRSGTYIAFFRRT